MRRSGRVTIYMTIKACNTKHAIRSFRFAIGGGVELLLRKLSNQQTQAFELLWIKQSIEELVEIIDGD